MKKIVLSALTIVSFAAYAFHEQMESTEETAPVVAPKSLETNTPAPSTRPAGETSPNPTATPGPQNVYKDGTYKGNVADAFYGNVQVQVIIDSGKITDVSFLQYPNDRGTSIRINKEAMPYLRQEAIKAQNAQVDIVSGATQTSLAFRESLKNALAKAKNV